jgi:hypothetical protein
MGTAGLAQQGRTASQQQEAAKTLTNFDIWKLHSILRSRVGIMALIASME